MINKTPHSHPPEPCAVLGAGELIAHLHRADDGYRIIVFRFRESGAPTHELRPLDLRDLVKLCQVLTFAVVDDGWLPMASQGDLKGLWCDLDELTCRWDGRDVEASHS